jgi:hypothetical protein
MSVSVAKINPPSIRENPVNSSKTGLRHPAPSPSPPEVTELGVQTAVDDVVKNNVQTPTVMDVMPNISEALLTYQKVSLLSAQGVDPPLAASEHDETPPLSSSAVQSLDNSVVVRSPERCVQSGDQNTDSLRTTVSEA